MLIEILRNKVNFTANEALLADFILNDLESFSVQSLRELADKAYVSPPTVTRLCKKLGYKSFANFKISLVSEYVERKKQLTLIDYNMPIKKDATIQQTVNAISKLSIDAINTAVRDFNYKTVEKVCDEIERLKYIDIYASGMSNSTAEIFAEKMTRIGYITSVITSDSQKYIRARRSDKNRVFAIVISYSNETSFAKRCVNYLYEAGVKKLLITGNKNGKSVPKSEYVYLMLSDEQILMNDKIDSFGEIIMLHFILDAIYAIIFQRNYDKNMNRVRETSTYQYPKQ